MLRGIAFGEGPEDLTILVNHSAFAHCSRADLQGNGLTWGDTEEAAVGGEALPVEVLTLYDETERYVFVPHIVRPFIVWKR